MTLEKAVEILNYHRTELDAHTDADTQDATKLGIEALKALITLRNLTHRAFHFLLPGED